ncbi:hypothetical protein BDQ17DRAFT_1437936 [Cyathus striatus]|nr:hypothetical protein BDQ17DRAFT_1437936 [Cyathus striatus]
MTFQLPQPQLSSLHRTPRQKPSTLLFNVNGKALLSPLTNRVEFSPEQTPSPGLECTITNRQLFNFYETKPGDEMGDSDKGLQGSMTGLPLRTEHLVSEPLDNLEQRPNPVEVNKLGQQDRTKLYRPSGVLGHPSGGGWSLKKTLGWKQDFYKEVQDFIHAIVLKYLDRRISFINQDEASIALFRQSVQAIYPVLSEYPRSWPIDVFAEMYLKNTSADHRKTLRKPTK